MEESILKTIKQLVGVSPDDDAFDLDLITHINTAFNTLNMLGSGPVDGFHITDETATWADFAVDPELDHSVKTYIGLRVRMYFDPPDKGHHVTAMNEQLDELAWYINTRREALLWVPPVL